MGRIEFTDDMPMTPQSAVQPTTQPIVQPVPFGSVTPVPVPSIVPVAIVKDASAPSPTISYWTTGFAFLAILFCGLWLREVAEDWRTGPDTDDTVVVDPVDGVYVSIVDVKPNDRDQLTDSQRQAVTSAELTGYLDQKNVKWLKYADGESLDAMEPAFQKLDQQHRSKLPWIYIQVGKRLVSQPIDSYDETMSLIKQWVK